jgi:putative transposase
MVKRYELSEAQWRRIADLLPGKATDPGRTGTDNRLFVNAVLWVLRSGARWSDLPERYGKWKTVHKRFARWAKAGVWERVFASLTGDPDNQYLMLYTTLVRAHQLAATGKGGPKPGSGAFPRRIDHQDPCPRRHPRPPLALHPRVARRIDITTAPQLLEDITASGIIADKAYDSDALRELIAEAHAEAVIPSKASRKITIPHNKIAYGLRNRIERFFNKLKHFRHIATRYDRRAIHFLACLHLASAMI